MSMMYTSSSQYYLGITNECLIYPQRNMVPFDPRDVDLFRKHDWDPTRESNIRTIYFTLSDWEDRILSSLSHYSHPPEIIFVDRCSEHSSTEWIYSIAPDTILIDILIEKCNIEMFRDVLKRYGLDITLSPFIKYLAFFSIMKGYYQIFNACNDIFPDVCDSIKSLPLIQLITSSENIEGVKKMKGVVNESLSSPYHHSTIFKLKHPRQVDQFIKLFAPKYSYDIHELELYFNTTTWEMLTHIYKSGFIPKESWNQLSSSFFHSPDYWWFVINDIVHIDSSFVHHLFSNHLITLLVDTADFINKAINKKKRRTFRRMYSRLVNNIYKLVKNRQYIEQGILPHTLIIDIWKMVENCVSELTTLYQSKDILHLFKKKYNTQYEKLMTSVDFLFDTRISSLPKDNSFSK